MLLIYKKSITIKKCDTIKVKICSHQIWQYEKNVYLILQVFVTIVYCYRSYLIFGLANPVCT